MDSSEVMADIAEATVWSNAYAVSLIEQVEDPMLSNTNREVRLRAAIDADEAVKLWRARFSRMTEDFDYPYVQAACANCGWESEKHASEAEAQADFEAHTQECTGA